MNVLFGNNRARKVVQNPLHRTFDVGIFRLDPSSIELDGISGLVDPGTGQTHECFLGALMQGRGNSEDNPIEITGEPGDHALLAVPQHRTLTPQELDYVAKKIDKRLPIALQRPGFTTLAELGSASLQQRVNFMPEPVTSEKVRELFNDHAILEEVTSSNSMLKDGQLQDKITTLLASQQLSAGTNFQLTDTHSHKLRSVCGPSLVADLTLHLVGISALPISTGAIIYLMRQDAGNEVESPENVGKAILYAQSMLRHVPSETRSSVIAGVTDMKTVLWLKVERSGDDFITKAEPSRPDVMETICALMMAAPLDLQVNIPTMSLHDSPLVVDELLGEGSTSIVYRCSDTRTSDAVAVKVPRLDYRGTELPDVPFLSKLQDIAGVPHIMGSVEVRDGTDTFQGLALAPVVKPLSDLVPSERQAVCMAVGQLVACLKAAHERGIINRDIRPENLAVHFAHDGSTQLYILDWGFAVQNHRQQVLYLGTLRYASNSVLQQLAKGRQAAAVRPQDDLVSLVRALRMWKLQDQQQQLAEATRLGDLQTNAQVCLSFWQHAVGLSRYWHELERLAEAGDYAKLEGEVKNVMCT